MASTNKDGDRHHGYGAPVAWIVALLGGYWVISEWNALPHLIDSAIAMVR